MRGRRTTTSGLLSLSAVLWAAIYVAAQEPGSPIAIVPLGNSATVTGALQVTSGKAILATSGTITSGTETTEVVLPRRGVLRVCSASTVKLTSDTNALAGEVPGLLIALDKGAVETSFAAGRNSDVLLTPDFHILIGGPGSVDVKVRLGEHGDTCVDNPGPNAPYVLVTGIFGGAYRVQPGQRVMFQHGSMQEVVDQEKESCGCPAAPRPGTNDFPLPESAGLTPAPPPVADPSAEKPSDVNSTIDAPLTYHGATPTEEVAGAQPAADPKVAQLSPVPALPKQNKRGFFHKVGGFFRRIFGAE